MQKYFQKGWDGEEPLVYPLMESPKGGEHSQLVSPTGGNPHGLDAPVYPGDKGFDDILSEVLEVRMQVLRGKWPADFLKKHHPRDDFDPNRIPVPLRRFVGDELNPDEATRSVVGDHPLSLPLNILGWLLEQGPESKRVDLGHVMFFENQFLVPENVSDASKRVATKALEAKYHFGLARPEEVLRMMGSLLTASIQGCPCHPSYPALHAAASSAAGQLDKEYYLKDEWLREIFDSLYHHSMYRTFGAFHYTQDNIAGLKLGGLWTAYWMQ